MTGRTRRGWDGWLRRTGDQQAGPPDSALVTIVANEAELAGPMLGPRGHAQAGQNTNEGEYAFFVLHAGTRGCWVRYYWWGDSLADLTLFRITGPGIDLAPGAGLTSIPVESSEIDFPIISQLHSGVTIAPIPNPWTIDLRLSSLACNDSQFWSPWYWVGPGHAAWWAMLIELALFNCRWQLEEPGSSVTA